MDSSEVMDFLNYSGEVGFQDVAKATGDLSAHLTHSPSSSALNHLKSSQFHAASHQIPVDAKPRLTKEQHDILESHYQQQSKPSTSTKREFADELGVTLDKVNNWFQNRRAKSKQDAKKQAGSYNIFNSDPSASQPTFNSDSDCSPAFSSPSYLAMQQWCSEEQAPSGPAMAHQHETDQQTQLLSASADDNMLNMGNLQTSNISQQAFHDLFDSPQEMNRRTLTQEQFDAISRNGCIPDGELFKYGEQVDLQSVFPELQNEGFKQQDIYTFPHPVGAPLSSNDSSIPSTISDQSMPAFPSSTERRESATLSNSSAEWGSSRSSSLAMNHFDAYPLQSAPTQQMQPASVSQWQPGQSVPVDANVLKQEFRQAAAQVRQSPQSYAQEQSPSWSNDEGLLRRDSSASSLAQSMSHVGIHTPQPKQSSTFEVPAPLDGQTIAARRQRPRPSRLPLHTLRSQSYSGSGSLAPGSPGQMLQQHQQQSGSLTPGAPLRRIRSSNVLNAVSQGRVMKVAPGSAQRSPMSRTFADGLNSPRVARHVSSQSQGSLAPPTPMSPTEYAGIDQNHQFHAFQAGSGHMGRQPSISESDFEHGVSLARTNYGQPKPFSSPPRTPAQQQQQMAQRVGSNVITENTPPQSAPATQQCFSANIFGSTQGQSPSTTQPQHPQHPMVASHLLPQAQPMMHMQHAPMLQQQQFVNALTPEQQFPMQAMVHPSGQHLNLSVTGQQGQPQFDLSQGVPMMNMHGEVQMFYPQPQYLQLTPQVQQPFISSAPAQPAHNPQQMPYTFMPAVSISPSMQVTAQVPKQAPPQTTEFFVHEYTPPQELKRVMTPRKLPDSGPKSYTFANQGPTDFEKGKKGEKSETKSAAGSSTSPTSSSSATASS